MKKCKLNWQEQVDCSGFKRNPYGRCKFESKCKFKPERSMKEIDLSDKVPVPWFPIDSVSARKLGEITITLNKAIECIKFNVTITKNRMDFKSINKD